MATERELYARGMSQERWDPFFEDLEQQFAAERDLARDELASEHERVRIAGLSLRDRLAAGTGRRIVADLGPAGVNRLRIEAIGADWVAGSDEDRPGLLIVRIDALEAVEFAPEDREATLAGGETDPLARRMTFGFVMRALTRRRAMISVGLVRGALAAGTPSLAGSDHLDLAIHDAGAAPRGSEVHGVRTISFRAIGWVRTASRRDAGVV